LIYRGKKKRKDPGRIGKNSKDIEKETIPHDREEST